MTHKAYLRHMEIIRENYSYVHCVNLMKKGKSDEQLINEEFEVNKNNKYNLFKEEKKIINF
jgi:hypothetical protein